MFSETVKERLEEFNVDVPSIFVMGAPKTEGRKRKRLPSSVSFDGKGIVNLNLDEDSKEILTDVHSLHLNNNNIQSWQDVGQLLQSLSGLTSLNLSSNPLEPFESLNEFVPDDFQYTNLHSLVLNDTKSSWKMILELMKIFPGVEEVHLCKNPHLNPLELQETIKNDDQLPKFPNIKRFYYNCNNCSDYRHLAIIGKVFPELDKLICLDNEIEFLCPNSIDNPMEDTSDCFSLCNYLSSLSSLNISGNKIYNWNCIEYLNNFPNLIDLRISNQPLFENMDDKSIWNELLGRLGNITKLNGSVIHVDDRVTAERSFVRSYLNAHNKPTRFDVLRSHYPDVQAFAHVDLSLDKVSVLLVSDSVTKITTVDPVITVANAYNEFCRLLNLSSPPDRYKFMHKDSEIGSFRILAVWSTLKLSSINVKSGDEFHFIKLKSTSDKK